MLPLSLPGSIVSPYQIDSFSLFDSLSLNHNWTVKSNLVSFGASEGTGLEVWDTPKLFSLNPPKKKTQTDPLRSNFHVKYQFPTPAVEIKQSKFFGGVLERCFSILRMYNVDWLSKRDVILVAAALELFPCILVGTVKELENWPNCTLRRWMIGWLDGRYHLLNVEEVGHSFEDSFAVAVSVLAPSAWNCA